MPSGGGTIYTHFTDGLGVKGIANLTPEELTIGQSTAVNKLQFGRGQTSFLNNGVGEIHVTDLGLEATAGELNQIGVFQSTGKQQYAIQFSQECLLCNGIRADPVRPNNFTIPANTTLENGTFTVTRRF